MLEFPGSFSSVQLAISRSGVYHGGGVGGTHREPRGSAACAAPAHAQVIQLHVLLPPLPHLFPCGPPVPSGCVCALSAWTPARGGLWWAGANWEQLCQPSGQHPPLPLQQPWVLFLCSRCLPPYGIPALLLVTQGGLKHYECNILCVIKVENHWILWGMFPSSVGLPIRPVLLSHQDAFLGKKEMAVSKTTSV